MPISCDTSAAPRLVRFVFDPEWTSALDLIEVRRLLVGVGCLTRDSAVLFDLRRATRLPTPADLRHALDSARTDSVWPACRAFLATTPEQYEVARQLQLLGPQSLISEIFQEEAAALEWLAGMTDRLGQSDRDR